MSAPALPSVLCVALGGALGSVLRFYLSHWAAQRYGDAFPWGTLLVNLMGSFLFGALWGLGPSATASPLLRALLFSGLLGGFTTFSSLMFDTARLVELGRPLPGVVNLIAQNVCGLGLLWCGYLLGRGLNFNR
jgi:fluoride exporter